MWNRFDAAFATLIAILCVVSSAKYAEGGRVGLALFVLLKAGALILFAEFWRARKSA